MIPVAPPTEENLSLAARALAQGGLVSFPTETVYGLGANALDPMALARIFEAKRRPFFDPLIVHIAHRSSLEILCASAPTRRGHTLPGGEGGTGYSDPRAEKLMDRFWPGPLTLVFPKSGAVPDLATSGLPTVAVRMPAHPVALELIRRAGFPVAAPSANPFGRLSPTTAGHVRDQFREGIELILDGGPCSVGVESTILSLAGETPVLLRAGGLAREEIEALIGPVADAASFQARPQSPGQLPGHYAPRTRLRLLRGSGSADLSGPASGAARIGYLGFRSVPADGGFAAAEILSASGDMREAAANLFACLHRLDRLELDLILAESLPEKGLGLAIMDRLGKAETGSARDP